MSSTLVSLEGFCDITVPVYDDSDRYQTSPNKQPTLTRAQRNSQSRLPAVIKKPTQQGYARAQFVKAKQAERRQTQLLAKKRQAKTSSIHVKGHAHQRSSEQYAHHLQTAPDLLPVGSMNDDIPETIYLDDNDIPQINPATGLPCINNSMVDVGGNLYGTNSLDDTNQVSSITPSSTLFDDVNDLSSHMSWDDGFSADIGMDDF